ncbi:hypothetical protein B0T14DRAFT_129604 [Immersiella caudata]|uniref:Uncharacterized protein n=1 Tax=Immersiella caudata TaxID=314043 RepID=A0AA40C6C2_9PEZI|nr:hypothetical protein B0T14DRAFT_129604 [Immersiella caudata]
MASGWHDGLGRTAVVPLVRRMAIALWCFSPGWTGEEGIWGWRSREPRRVSLVARHCTCCKKLRQLPVESTETYISLLPAHFTLVASVHGSGKHLSRRASPERGSPTGAWDPGGSGLLIALSFFGSGCDLKRALPPPPPFQTPDPRYNLSVCYISGIPAFCLRL